MLSFMERAKVNESFIFHEFPAEFSFVGELTKNLIYLIIISYFW